MSAWLVRRLRLGSGLVLLTYLATHLSNHALGLISLRAMEAGRGWFLLLYDVVFILNRYFEAVGGAISRSGGIANQFTGDGVMALFGVEAGPEEGCRQALAAAGRSWPA